MHLEVSSRRVDGFNEVATVHGDQRIYWEVTTYGRVNAHNIDTIFDDINQYWASLDTPTQQQIFDCYAKIKEELELFTEPMNMAQRIQKIVTAMYRYMPLEGMTQWLYMYGNMYIFPDIPTDDTVLTSAKKETTYLREDYIALMGLALAVRPMIPIWGEYLTQSGQNSDSGLFKEMDALSLAGSVEFMHSVPARRLMDYIDHTAQRAFRSGVNLNTILKGMGTSDIPLWLFSLVVIRRLTIAPLSDPTVNHSLIANIHKFISNRLKPEHRGQDSKVKEKKPDTRGTDDDDKTSNLENYKIKQSIADGDVVLFNVYSRNVTRICQKVDPTFDLNLFEEVPSNLTDNLMAHPIADHQVHLAQWALAPVIPPRAFRHANKQSVVRFLVAAQLLLWHWGFCELAVFLTVKQGRAIAADAPHINPNPRPNTRIPQQQLAILDELYPHGKPQKARASAAQANPAVVELNALTVEINRQSWVYLGPSSLKRLTEQPNGRQTLVNPTNLKHLIIDLVIHHARRRQ